MESTTHKLYHVHGFDSRQHLENYFSDKPDMAFQEDALKFPIESLTKTFSKGHIRGDVLIDLSNGSFVHHLYAACEFFQHIIVLKVSDRCIMELKRWLDTRTGAFDWGHAAKLHGEIEGRRYDCRKRRILAIHIGNQSTLWFQYETDQFPDKEEKVRSAIPHVVKCDLDKENMTDPVLLPPADCIISVWLLDVICKNQDDYKRYLRKFSGFLNPGGHLILIGALGETFMTVGRDKIHVFTYDEDFARKALVGEGFVIDNCKVKKRTAVSDLSDYKALIFIAAHKEK